MKPRDQAADLTDGQKACLRLVADHRTSKEIARLLGISPFTVDQRLDAARRKLKADNRKDAARIFALAENNISDPLVYQSQPLENIEIADKSAWSTRMVGRIFSRIFSFVSVPPIGGAKHNLSARNILVQSLNIAFFGTLVIATVTIILTGMMDLLA